jgi:hypothetical protein
MDIWFIWQYHALNCDFFGSRYFIDEKEPDELKVWYFNQGPYVSYSGVYHLDVYVILKYWKE